jgi:DNA-binding NarL/FixJ family response regulator
MKRRVLVIDDHSPSRKDLVPALARRGFEVVGEASSGSAGVWLAKTSAPDVILMAVGLADMDGIRAARMMMEEHPLPIVLLTSHYDRETIERAKGSGVMA